MARRGAAGSRLRLLGAMVLIVLIGGGAGWWHMRHWTPDRDAWPRQGVEVGAGDVDANLTAIKAIGADFVYLDASVSAFARDPGFVANLEAARAAKLQVGAVHRYDPCQPAEKQAANFVTVVPRDSAMLPAAVELEQTGDDCLVKPGDAAIESELTTFLNQVETHTGKAVILKIGPEFEDRYHIAARIDRNIWLTRDRFQPDYAGRPWTLWTANSAFASEAGGATLRWLVVQR